jgi:hypothetical protein
MNLHLRHIFVFLFLFCLGITARPIEAQSTTVWYVDDLGDGKIGTGAKEDPFRDLQKAIDSAGDGDQIIILPGNYEATSAPYIEELCGNCQEHKTQVNATRGFLIKNKSLQLVG